MTDDLRCIDDNYMQLDFILCYPYLFNLCDAKLSIYKVNALFQYRIPLLNIWYANKGNYLKILHTINISTPAWRRLLWLNLLWADKHVLHIIYFHTNVGCNKALYIDWSQHYQFLSIVYIYNLTEALLGSQNNRLQLYAILPKYSWKEV